MPDLKIKRAPQTDSETRAWETVYDDINDIINSVNQKSTVESRNGTSGGDGDIRLFKDVDKTKYFIEGKFGDGWAKRELLFSDPNIDTQDESINFSATEAYVKPDGSVPFTAVQTGISPSNDNHLATKGYVDGSVTLAGSLDYLTISNQIITRGSIVLTTDVTGTLPINKGGTNATSFTTGKALEYVNGSIASSSINLGTLLVDIVDTAATAGTGGQHGNLPTDHVCLVEDGGASGNQAKIYNVKSANTRMTISDSATNGSDFIEFNVADQALNINRFDTVYTYNSGDETKDTAAADGADGIAFVDTANTTWTAVAPAGSGAYTNKAKVSLVTANDNTTYSTNASTVSGGANFNLLAANPTSTDALKFAGTGATTVTRTDASTITISSSAGVTSIIDANDPGGASYKSLVVSGSAGVAELIKVKGSGSTSVSVTTQGDPVEYFLDISSSQRGIDDTPVNNQTAESISSNWAYDHENHSTMHDNFYLTGVTKSSNTLTFAISGAANPTYTFGSNAFNSTAFLSSIVPSAASGTNLESMVDDGSGGRIYSIKGGTGITVSIEGSESADYLEIASTVDTSGLLTNGIVIIEDWNGSEVEETASASGGDKLRFVENDGIEWSISGPTSNVISVTPSLSGYNSTNWDNAYGWGNHGSAGYITGNQTITLSGDATGSGTTGITVVVANDSHTHDTRYYTESEVDTSLALKSNLAGPTFTGTVSMPYLRISSTGDAAPGSTTHGFQVGTTSSNVIIDNNEVMARASGVVSTLHLNADGGGVIFQSNSSGNEVEIDTSGNVMCKNLKASEDVWAYTSSDVSLKDNRKLIESPLDMISKIGGYSFDWNSKAASHLKGHDYGVMANEIESVMPELVTTREDGIKAVRYDGIIPLLIEAIKELKEELDGIRKL